MSDERIRVLEDEIRKHNRLYWDQAKPEIDDYAYDALVRELKELSPDSAVLTEMGPTVPTEGAARLGKAVRHERPMLSLDKCYSDEELRNWLTSFRGDVVAMPKFDGIACSLHYDENGRLLRAVTRGDGVTGDDITQNATRIKHLPTKIGLKGPLEIRGEIYMRLSVFAKYKAEGMANPRNLTAGAIKQKDPEKSGAYGLSFAAYGVLGGPVERREIESFSGELDALREAGFTRIDYVKLSQEEAPEGYARFAKERTTLDYEIDGVVYKVDAHREQERLGQTSHHPRYALAYKFQGDAGVTTLREVEWSVARTGAITPVALVEPVALSGVTVSRASLHNVSFIDKLGLTLGAKVTLVRRGGVIPNVEHVVEAGPQPVAIPSVCPSCGAAVVRERDFIYCSSPSTCRSAVIGQLAHFASVLDMLGFGEALLEQSYDAGILRSFADFYRLQADQLLKLERAGEKLAKKLLGEVEKKRTLDLAMFLRALGINELGKNVSEILATRYQTLERVRAASVAELAAEHSIGETIAASVVEGLQRSSDAIDDLLKYVKFEARALSGGESGPLAGKSFVFTGKMVAFARNEGEKRVRNAGGSVLSSVTKALDYLVIGADKEGGKSTKEKAADKLVAEGGKLKILSEDEFLQMVAS